MQQGDDCEDFTGERDHRNEHQNLRPTSFLCGICSTTEIDMDSMENACKIHIAAEDGNRVSTSLIFCRSCIQGALQNAQQEDGLIFVESTEQPCESCALCMADRRLLIPGLRSFPICVDCLKKSLLE